MTGDRYRKSKLSRLTEIFLSEQIQTGNDGHSPVEDSLASLKLVQLKLSHSMYTLFLSSLLKCTFVYI